MFESGAMTLPEYIRSIGVESFAKKFGVSERAATSWLYRQRFPRATVAKRIVQESPVTWDGIYTLAPSTSEARVTA